VVLAKRGRKLPKTSLTIVVLLSIVLYGLSAPAFAQDAEKKGAGDLAAAS
jgi:hypothetical protein